MGQHFPLTPSTLHIKMALRISQDDQSLSGQEAASQGLPILHRSGNLGKLDGEH